jgi:hypothetical protein
MRTELSDGKIVLKAYRAEHTEALYEAVREGILRKRLWLHGRPHDAALYSLVAEDLQPSPS